MKHENMSKALEHIAKNLELLKKDLSKANSQCESDQEIRLEGEIKDEIKRRNLITAAKERIERDIASLSVKENKKKANYRSLQNDSMI